MGATVLTLEHGNDPRFVDPCSPARPHVGAELPLRTRAIVLGSDAGIDLAQKAYLNRVVLIQTCRRHNGLCLLLKQ